MINLLEARLRSSPHFRLIPFDQLEEGERQAFQALSEEPDFYGLLAPPSTSAMPVKSVSRDAALLFMTLREPACVPQLLTSLFGGNVEDRLRQLVLDGVFEIERAGGFVSGAAALPSDGSCADHRSTCRVAQLSSDAIAYAATLEGLSTSEMAARLYMYNRAPSTAQLQRRFANDDRLLAYVLDDMAMPEQLGARWIREISQDWWLMWRTSEPVARQGFKLYVSPALDNLPQAFRAMVEALVRVRCTQFKIGRTAFGLLRPDKFVAYFHSLDQLHAAAELMLSSMEGVSAQGVPFTAAIDADGLISWGMDPPRFDQVLAWQERQSWRQWVAERIAVYTLAARESGTEDVPGFVLQRVSLDGIDTTTWSPNLAIWRGWAGSEAEVA